MVKLTSLFLGAFALTALAHVAPAHAEDYDDGSGEYDDEPGFNMLDMRFAMGGMPVDRAPMLTVSLGLGVEHPVFKKTRVFGEYEWLWLFDRPTERTYMLSPLPPERHGTGHRAMLGLRRELVGKGRSSFRTFVDGEVGGGLALTNDNMSGFQTLPTGFVGLRVGYDLYSREDDSPSRTFELELLFRMLLVPDGTGVLGGIGMAWGN